MNKLFIFLLLCSINVQADFNTKCSILITLRLQSTDDAYQDAISKIDQCEKYDILSITSFLDASISKVYITDLLQTYCMFNHEIITLIDNKTSYLSCIHRGNARIERNIN